MHELPQVDVIILSWNRLEDTLDAIASAVSQSGVDHHIYVVDQGSQPAAVAQLEAAIAVQPRVTLQKLGKNVGVPAGRNVASRMGRAPYVVALDSDAVFADASVLARAVSYMDDNPQLCALGFAILNYYTGEPDWASWDYPKHYDPARAFNSTRFVGAGHIIRRSTFEAVGGYDDNLVFCGEELDVCYRMINTGLRIKYLPELAVRHKVTREHRVFWERGRYYQTVRNALYSLYKFGTPWPRLFVAAGAFWLRGINNGVGREAARAVLACVPMCIAFERSVQDKSVYALSPETWRYIRECEPTRSESWWSKLKRQFVALPTQCRELSDAE